MPHPAAGSAEDPAIEIDWPAARIGGHAYAVEETSDLEKKDWKPCAFMLPDSDVPVNIISVPSNAGLAPSTVYLLPANPSNAFFRVRSK